MKRDQYKTHKQPQGTRIADTRRLVEIMHYHGAYQFLDLLRQAYFEASEGMEDIDEEISELYRELANQIELTEETES